MAFFFVLLLYAIIVHFGLAEHNKRTYVGFNELIGLRYRVTISNLTKPKTHRDLLKLDCYHLTKVFPNYIAL